MAKIYTKIGDDGSTGLIGGKRVPKDDPRVDAYGTVDELNAAIGMVRAHDVPESIDEILGRVQDGLFTVGANLAVPEGVDPSEWSVPSVNESDIAAIEKDIDECELSLEPLRQFILPGGVAPSALLHYARTVARRAERTCVALARHETVDPQIIRYLNRLSDLCFVLARRVNRMKNRGESHPTFGKG